MKKSFFISIILTILLGAFFGKFLYQRYEAETVMESEENLYFLQYGVYSNEEEARREKEKITPSLLIREDNKFYLYLGISHKKEMLEKVKKIYDEEDKITYIKTVPFSNMTFLNHLYQWDVLLENARTKEEILSISKVVLADYEETVLMK